MINPPSFPAGKALAALLLGCGLWLGAGWGAGAALAQQADPITFPTIPPGIDPSLPGLPDPTVPPPVVDPLAPTPTAPAPTSTSTDPYLTNNTSTITGNNPQCDQALQKAYDEGRAAAITAQQFRDSDAFKYAVSGAYTAQCVSKTIKYAEQFIDVIANAQTTITAATNPVLAAVNFAARSLLKVVVQQIISALNNQICQITSEITSFGQSFLQNAICLPSGSIGAFNFSIPQLVLPRADTCSGFAISPIGLAGLYPSSYSTGTGAPTGTGTLGPNVTGTHINAGRTASAAANYDSDSFVRNFNPPAFRPEIMASDDDGGVQGMKLPLFTNDDAGGTTTPPGVTTPPTPVGKVCGNGGSDAFLQEISKHECKGGKGWDCDNGSYVGKWQLGCSALRGCVVNACPARSKNLVFLPNCGGTLQGFLNNHAIQTAAATRFETQIWRYVNNRPGRTNAAVGKVLTYTKYKGKLPNCTPVGTASTVVSLSGLLASGHLVGQGGAWAVMKAVESGRTLMNERYALDGNCTSAGVYAAAASGFDISAFSGKSCR